MSKARVDLPEPDTPVTTVNRPRGISTSMFFRLCSRALWMRIDVPRYWPRGSRTAGGVLNASSYSRSALPVCDVAWVMTSAGGPSHTSSPPASPPSGPRSMIQSEARITSRLCSMTTSEWPAPSSWRNARSSLATSSKCRPVVGSSNRNSLLPSSSTSARCPASFRRCASPPDSVGTGWPRRRYSRPTSISGCRRSCTASCLRKKRAASATVSSSTSAIDLPSTFTSRISSR